MECADHSEGFSDAHPCHRHGNDRQAELLRFIELMEEYLWHTVEKRLLPMQPGDVPDTWADVSALRRDVN